MCCCSIYYNYRGAIDLFNLIIIICSKYLLQLFSTKYDNYLHLIIGILFVMQLSVRRGVRMEVLA